MMRNEMGVREMKYQILIIMILSFIFSYGCAPSKSGTFSEAGLKIVSMKEWGGTPAIDSLARKQRIRYITLHHEGETFPNDKDPIQYLRELQEWSRQVKHWMDIPYHYIIDLYGRIYEGRKIEYAGDTNTDYDPTGHALICVVGNYEEISPNEIQLAAVVKLMTMLAEKYSLSPGAIKGHLDYSKMTVCPGKNLYQYLSNGYFREQVELNLSKSKQ
jgi:hypothetical protein